MDSMQYDHSDGTLVVYKASAGSGKTYTLTKEYIGLLLRGWLEERTSKHDRILAATFTNKATIELRERIIRELIHIRDSRPNNMGEVLLEEWCMQGEISDTKYRQWLRDLPTEGAKLLKALLEDYSSFRVQTIDAFFQEVVRSFALEISSVSGAYDIELHELDLIRLAIERLFVRLGDEQYSGVMRILSDIFLEDAESGEEKQNIRGRLIALTAHFLSSRQQEQQLDRDDYTEAEIQSDRTLLKSLIQQGHEAIESVRQELLARLESVVQSYGLDLSLSTRSFLVSIQQHMSLPPERFRALVMDDTKPIVTATIRQAIEEQKPLYPKSKSTAAAPSYDAATPELYALLADIAEMQRCICGDEGQTDSVRSRLRTADLILKYLSLMPALFEIRRAVEEYQRENNVLMISRINDLMNSLIGDSDVPFIYDKVGVAIEHFMIDEFQDTDQIQWGNFLPLLKESMANGRKNIVVGDVKQSIYRFRGTDSSLLGSEVVSLREARVHTLGTNWRSAPRVVSFNNTFFEHIYSETIGTGEWLPIDPAHAAAYDAGVAQHSHRSEGGYVEIRIGERREKNNAKEQQEELRESVIELLRTLQVEQGYAPKDIALLVRNNRDAALLAEWLNSAAAEHPSERALYRFISDEALALSASHTVQLLAQYISYVSWNRSEPKERELQLYVEIYLRGCGRSEERDRVMSQLRLLGRQGHGVYEAMAHVLDILQPVPESELVYTNSFLDQLFEFASLHTTTYRGVEEWWLQNADTFRIEMSNAPGDYITIITIHKSKGLEYPVVVMPLADWEISKTTGFASRALDLFHRPVTPDDMPLQLPRYFVDATPTRSNLTTFFRPEYLEHMEADYMDSLNLLYVAFTRAADQLYVFTSVSKKNDSGSEAPICRVGDLIHKRLRQRFDLRPDERIYCSGTRGQAPARAEEHNDIVELKHLTANPRYDHLEYSTRRYQSSEMQSGVIWHQVLQQTVRSEDFAGAAARAVASHQITMSEAKEYEHRFGQAIASSDVIAGWFAPAPDAEVLTEASITTAPDQGLLRPDRLILEPSTRRVTVVDYKIGQHQSRYTRQLQHYMRRLSDMGFAVTGYLWYNLSAQPEDVVQVQLRD